MGSPFKTYFQIVATIIFTILLFDCIYAQSYEGRIILSNDSTLIGKITVTETEGVKSFSFTGDKQNIDKLTPSAVSTFFYFLDPNKNRSRVIYKTIKETNLFWERIYSGDHPIYKSAYNNYAIELNGTELHVLSNDIEEIKSFFLPLINTKPKIGVLKNLKNIRSIIKTSNLINTPKIRYPKTYIGLKLAYGQFSIIPPKTVEINNTQMGINKFLIAGYIRKTIDNQGNWAVGYTMGIEQIRGSGSNMEGLNQFAFSVNNLSLINEVALIKYLPINRSSFYLIGSIGYSIRLLEQVLSINTAITSTGVIIQEELRPSNPFKSSMIPYKVGLGNDFPISKNWYISAEIMLSSINDIEGQRTLYPELSILFNVF